MPTPSEKKALAFVAVVMLLGGAVRVLRAGASPESTGAEQQALARQATAAESAVVRAKPPKSRARTSRARRDTLPRVVAGVATVPGTFARPDAPDAHAPYGTRSEQLGFPPPGPRIDIGARQARKDPGRTRIDLDRASAAEIEALPRIGPALARRIVANRDSQGPFRTLQSLRRVKGVGPATLEIIAPLVSFGGSPPTGGPRP